jgi:tRNA1Val (adenine37-N6)-methyltransferase
MKYNEFWPGGPVFLHGEGFSIGTDAVMLYGFSKDIKCKNICDLGCGSGVIGILLAYENSAASVTGIEIQESSARAAETNASLNNLSGRFRVINGDLREYRSLLPAGAFDLAVMNPPYYPSGSGKVSHDLTVAIARDERMCTLEDACRAASYVVKWGGRFCMVHKPERMAEVICTMHSCGLEPKRLRFVQHCPGSKPNLVLIESIRGGKPGITVELPFILTDENGHDTPEAAALYHRDI